MSLDACGRRRGGPKRADILQRRSDVPASTFSRSATDYAHLHCQFPPSEPLGEWLTLLIAIPKPGASTPDGEELVGKLPTEFGRFAARALSAAERAAWRHARAALDTLPDSGVLRMRAHVEFAERFPRDERVPELLAEATGIPRYNWCIGADASRTSQHAFELRKR